MPTLAVVVCGIACDLVLEVARLFLRHTTVRKDGKTHKYWRPVRDGIEAKVCLGPEGSETFLLVRSAERQQKEQDRGRDARSPSTTPAMRRT